MNLAQAKAAFLDEQQQRPEAGDAAAPLKLLYDYFANLPLDDLTPASLRHFLAVHYLEEAIRHSHSAAPSTLFPDAQTMLASLTHFFAWLDEKRTDHTDDLRQAATPEPDGATSMQGHLAVLQSLQNSLPRAIAITRSLSDALAHHGGAFAFPEFLTSFEAGGQSEYDIGDAAGEASAIEGYFHILSLDGTTIEARESISERLVSPILFPEATAALLDTGYLINLELVSLEGNWQIVGCGFAYPPDTEL